MNNPQHHWTQINRQLWWNDSQQRVQEEGPSIIGIKVSILGEDV
jgi:hypothetical protein